MNRFFHGTQQRTLWIVVLGFALASCRHSASTRMAVSARTVELNASPIPSTLAALYSLDVDEHDVVLTQDVFFDAASACFADLVAAVDRVEELLVLRILESVSQRTRIPMERFFNNIARYGNTS